MDPEDIGELNDQYGFASYFTKDTPAKEKKKPKRKKPSTWHLCQMKAMSLSFLQHFQLSLQSLRLMFKWYFSKKQELEIQWEKENILILCSSTAVRQHTMFTRNQRRGSQHDEILRSVGVLSKNEVTKYILSRQNPLTDWSRALSVSACLQPPNSAKAALHYPAAAFSNCKCISRKCLSGACSSPEEGHVRKAGVLSCPSRNCCLQGKNTSWMGLPLPVF